MPPIKDLTGKVFGDLVVLEFSHINKFHRSCWLCKCVCGNTTVVIGNNLLRKKTQSCGCKEGNPFLLDNQAAFNQLYGRYKREAKNRNISFEIKKDDFFFLSQERCFYCGTKPQQRLITHNNQLTPFLYNGIDRINNLLGYIYNNVVPCCKQCNRMKSNLPIEDFKKTHKQNLS